MRILTEQKTLVQTRQRVEFVLSGKEKGRTFLVIGPASDGTWMVKETQEPAWTSVDTSGQCHNHFYGGRTRPVSDLELTAFEQHKVQLAQGRLF